MKVYKDSAGQVITIGKALEIDGIAYPLNWFDHATPEDLEARGFTVEEIPDPVPIPAPILSVTPRQARLALLAAGLLDQVEAAVTTLGGATKITWDYATAIERNSTFIATLATALKLTDAQIDDLFTQAATL